MLELNTLYNMDCMDGMKEFPDKYFDLAIVDPPYGIGIDKWDIPPNERYFKELFRISNNQIIWGGNYFNLPITESWICWDKTFSDDIRQKKLTKAGCPREKMADFELIWTSFKIKATFLRYTYIGNLIGFNDDLTVDYKQPSKIHSTQKPIALYRWLLANYAEGCDKIIDTHVGSGSSIIACKQMDFDWIGFELDKDYYEAALKRIERETAQYRLAI